MFATNLNIGQLDQFKPRKKQKRHRQRLHLFAFNVKRSTSHFLNMNNLLAFSAATIGGFLAARMAR